MLVGSLFLIAAGPGGPRWSPAWPPRTDAPEQLGKLYRSTGRDGTNEERGLLNVISHLEMIGRIAAGAALGGVIGYERDVHGRPVGLRTHFIVAMTAATFMVISSQFVYFQRYGHEDMVGVDTSRIAAS